MKKIFIFSLYLGWVFYSCQPNKPLPEGYASKFLRIQKLKEGIYQHTSYLQTPQFGKVPCNGLIVVSQEEAIIFDTPVADSASQELIQWIEEELHSSIKAVVATHFHIDCLGSLPIFHTKHIPSYAKDLTIQLSREEGSAIPQNEFKQVQNLTIGSQEVVLQYFGEGHTRDNIVGYIPKDEVLFGGCLIKSQGAGKGYLGDANVQEWSNTVAKIKDTYPNLKYVIPGHGKAGGTELLDFTIALFKNPD